MTLGAGTRLGPYDIQSALGAGGMGEVYRARDTRLGRDVAVKVLPSAVSTDHERLRRFEQEARAAAALNHPNILAVFDIGLEAGAPFIVMELLEGDTLRERLASGVLPSRKAVEYAGQMAHGLAAAHGKGIVHRDLKPDNVFVTGDGRVKILDFGLAKLIGPAEAGHYVHAASAVAGVSQAPTLSPPTTPGVVLGTVGYMAPEQVRGEGADHRADLFALGCILYEMLGGRRAFAAATTAETMTAILREEPPELPLDRVPPGLARIVNRCLEKDPGARFQTATDLAFALEALSSTAVPLAATVSGRRAADVLRWPVPAWIVAAVLAGSVAAAILLRAPDPRNATGGTTTRLELSLPAGVELFVHHGAIAISSDGDQVAFVGVRGGVRQIYLRRLGQFEATPLRGTETVVVCFFAPTGDAIGFTYANGAIGRVSLTDGSVTTLTEDTDYSARGAWGPDGRILFTRAGALWQVPAAGGAATALTTLDEGRREVLHSFPVVTGNGAAVLFSAAALGSAARTDALMPDGSRKVLIEASATPVAAEGGYVVFFREGALLAAPFDASRGALTGAPVRVVQNLGVDAFGGPLAVVSAAGTLVYQSADSAGADLVRVARDGTAKIVIDQPRSYANPRLSPDGMRIVVEAAGDLWMFDIDRTTFTRLTSDPTAANSFPIWVPDGRRIVFKTRTNLRWIDANGSGRVGDIAGTTASDFPGSVSADGRLLAYLSVRTGNSGDVYVRSLEGDAAERLIVDTPALDGGPQFSPDSRWLAYVSNDTGPFQVYLRSLAGPDRRWQVSTDGGTSPRWSHDGRELFYRNGDRMMVVDVSTGTEPQLSRPRVLFEGRFAYGTTITLPNYDVTPDGQSFIMVRDPAGAGRLNVVLNWFSELARLAPAGHE